MLPRAGRLRISGNHKLIFLVNFHFQPFGGARFHVRRGKIFRDQSLVSLGAARCGKPRDRWLRVCETATAPCSSRSISPSQRAAWTVVHAADLCLHEKGNQNGIHRFALVLLKELESGNPLLCRTQQPRHREGGWRVGEAGWPLQSGGSCPCGLFRSWIAAGPDPLLCTPGSCRHRTSPHRPIPACRKAREREWQAWAEREMESASSKWPLLRSIR